MKNVSHFLSCWTEGCVKLCEHLYQWFTILTTRQHFMAKKALMPIKDICVKYFMAQKALMPINPFITRFVVATKG